MTAAMRCRATAILAMLAACSAGCRDILGIHELWDVDGGPNVAADAGPDALPVEASVGAEAGDSSLQEAAADHTTGAIVDVAIDGDAMLAVDAPEASSEPDGSDAKAEEGGDGAAADGPGSSTCTPGGSCNLGGCKKGQLACVDGGPVCQDAGNVTNGTACGATAGHVCDAGQCVACDSGGDCTDPSTPCVKKTYDCASGAPVCKAAGNAPEGSSCTGGKYCYSGVCSACTLTASCTPPGNPCGTGKVTSCAGGVPTCTDSMKAATDGTSCQSATVASGVCSSGVCVSCTPSAVCHPGDNPCQSGTMSCASGPMCGSASNVNEGGSCGAHLICTSGSCVTKCDSTTCANGCCGGNTCDASETIAACGTGGVGCGICSAPSNGVAACNGQAGCGFTCKTGYVVCSNACCPQIVVTGGTLFATQGVEMGGTIATVADANTAEVASALTAFIDWGDGTTSFGNISGSSGSFTVTTKHTYTTYPAGGKSTVSITVTSGTTNASGVSTVTATVRPASTATITEFTGLTLAANSIAAGSDGNLWFSEITKIGVITTAGAVSEFLLSQGMNAYGLVVDATSRTVWFTDYGNAIGWFDTMTHYSGEYAVPDTFVARPSAGITWGPDGNLWFAESAGMNARGPLGRFTPGTRAFAEFLQPVSAGGSGANTVVVGPDGNLWFPDTGGYIGGTPGISRFTLSNSSFTKFPVSGILIAVGPDGRLWFSDSTGVGRLATDGTLLSHFSIAMPPSGLNGITAGPDHNIWFSETNKVARLTTTGALTEFPVATANCCGALVTGPDSNIWFADGTAIGRIQP